MPSFRNSSITRVRASSLEIGKCCKRLSATWRPTLWAGFSEESVSWKIMPIFAPRMSRICFPNFSSLFSSTTLSPWEKRISPLLTSPLSGSSCTIACAVTDFPQPDSPTTQRKEPRGMLSETSRKICKVSSSTLNLTFTLLRSRIKSLLVDWLTFCSPNDQLTLLSIYSLQLKIYGVDLKHRVVHRQQS